MRLFGFSTGALALGDFKKALKMLEGIDVDAIELSALRVHELPSLLTFAKHADLTRFSHIIKQIHISVVNTSSKHDIISPNVVHAFQSVAFLIPSTIPVILETPVKIEQIRQQLEMAAASLDAAPCKSSW